jgi:hypothetical protein
LKEVGKFVGAPTGAAHAVNAVVEAVKVQQVEDCNEEKGKKGGKVSGDHGIETPV